MSAALPRIVVVAGLSGSGKTTAMAALEDQGCYCVENLPAQLIEPIARHSKAAATPIEKLALAIDAREVGSPERVPTVLAALRRAGADISLLFLDCSDQVLLNRYRETRRAHPLSPEGSVAEGIERERKVLAELSELADQRIETSDLSVHQLRAAVAATLADDPRHPQLNLLSFGFRFGLPSAADLVFDVRFLPNPYFEPALRDGSGLDPEVADFVLNNDPARKLLEHLGALLGFLLPLYDEEGKVYLTLAIGCTGGRHRSVATACALAARLERAGCAVSLQHRDAERC